MITAWLRQVLPAGMLPRALSWLCALAACLLSFSLLNSYAQIQAAHREALVQELAPVELADVIARPDDPDASNRVRALMLRTDVGFAWLRLRDAQDVPVAVAGRLDGWSLAPLPSGMARPARMWLYGVMSSQHSMLLAAGGRTLGTLDYGLIRGGGDAAPGNASRLWLGIPGLALAVLWLWASTLLLIESLSGDLRSVSRASRRAVVTHRTDALPATPEGQMQAGQLMAAFHQATLMVDRYLRVTQLNAPAERLTGWRAADALGHAITDVLPLSSPDPGHFASLPIKKCLDGRAERVHGRMLLRRRLGTTAEVEVTAAPLRDSVGAVTGVILTLSEPVAPRSAVRAPAPRPGTPERSPVLPPSVPVAQAVAEPPSVSQLLLDQVLDSVVATDSQDRIQFANDRALQNFGYALAEIKGVHISRLLPVPFQKQAQLRVADLARTAGPEGARAMAMRRDTTRFMVNLLVRPVAYEDRQGHVLTIRAVVRDTPRLSARLRHLLDNAGEAICVFDSATLKILDATGQLSGHLGYSPEQLKRMTFMQLSPQLSPEMFETHVVRLRLGEENEVTFRTPLQGAQGGRFDAEVRMEYLAGEDPPVYLARIADRERPADAAKAFDEDKLGFMAMHDSLTGLPSRQMFIERLAKAVAEASQGGRSLAVLCVGVSALAEINSRSGYETGDQLLKAVADRLSRCAGSEDTVARLDGVDFGMIVSGSRDRDIEDMPSRILEALRKPFRAGLGDYELPAYVGGTRYPLDDASPEALLLHAEQALVAAKRRRTPGYVGYKAAFESAGRPLTAAEGLRALLLTNQLAVDLQPLVDVSTSQVVAAELLFSWHHPEHGLLRSVQQARAVEHVRGLADEIGYWVLQRGCEEYSNWRDVELPTVPLVINASLLGLVSIDAASRICGLLARYRVPADGLIACASELELRSMQASGGHWVKTLRKAGVRIGADDIDEGSIDILRQADIDIVRLMPRTTAGIPDSAEAMERTRAAIQTGRKAGAQVVVTHVDHVVQMEALNRLGCKIMQGQLLGEASGSRQFARRLSESMVGAI